MDRSSRLLCFEAAETTEKREMLPYHRMGFAGYRFICAAIIGVDEVAAHKRCGS